MIFRRWAVRIVLFAGGVVLSLVLVAFLAVQIQQRMMRWHAERLLADMHQIRLYQSTWADAQRLMYRWGAWATTTEAARRQVASTKSRWSASPVKTSVFRVRVMPGWIGL
jgi:hypothetical protein